MQFLIKIFLYSMHFRSLIIAIFNLSKVFQSLRKFHKLKKNKCSDTVTIISAGKRISDDIEFVNNDIFVNSNSYKNIKKEVNSKVKICYFGRLEKQNDLNEYKKRVKDAKSKFKKAFIITEASKSYTNKKTDIFSLRAIYLSFLKYPFLRPHNGPAFLIWLAYCLGYKKIILDGVESTMIKGVVLSRELYSNNIKKDYLKHTSKIASVVINCALMIYEYELLFLKITKKVRVNQLSPSSWSQPYSDFQQVCAADDSWNSFLLNKKE
tara:strand:- start:5 stop:802 length:798 start_codon:yes stop_codon:yes gene_type:complete